MSFEIYLQVFERGDESGFSAEILRRAFGEHLVELEPDYWQVRYDANESSDLLLQRAEGDASLIHSVSVHRPCQDERLWEALYGLLEVPGSLLYFPGGASPLTRDVHVSSAAPSDMLESLGEPVIVASAKDLLLAVESA